MSEQHTSTSDKHLKSAQREQKKDEQRDDWPFFVFTCVVVIV